MSGARTSATPAAGAQAPGTPTPGTPAAGAPIRRRIAGAACALALAGLGSGCAQAVPGTPWAQGDGPSAAVVRPGQVPDSGAEPGTPSPPTSFTVPGPPTSGRPTVTVLPEPRTGASTTPLPPQRRDPSGLPPAAPAAPTIGSGPTPAPTTAPGRPDRIVEPRRERTGPAAPAPEAPAPVRRPSVPAPTPLTSDVVPDECLLDRAGFTALLGQPAAIPANHIVSRPGGASTRSCYAAAGSGTPSASVNVYRVNAATPAAFLRTATGSRPFSGVGVAAVLVDTVGGPALQIATPRLLITIAVADRTPDDARWRAAGRAAVSALDG